MDFEEIIPFDGIRDTGKDARNKLSRNFTKVKDKFTEVDSKVIGINYKSFTNSDLGNRFIKELYVSGSGLDANKIYYLDLVCRNNVTYNNALIFKVANPDFSGSQLLLSTLYNNESDMLGVVSLTNIAGDVNIKMILDWTQFENGINTGETLKIVFNKNAFDKRVSSFINFSDNIVNYTESSTFSNGKDLIHAIETGDTQYGNVSAVGVYRKISRDCHVNTVKVRACAQFTGTPVTIKVYKTTLTPGSGLLSQYNLIASVSQIWDSNIEKIKSIRFENTYVSKNDYIIVCFSTLTSTRILMKMYSSNTASMKGFLFNAGTDYPNLFTTAWSKSDDESTYCQVQPEVSFESPATFETIQEMNERIDHVDIERKIICTDIFHAVVGQELNIYYDSLINSDFAGNDLYIDISCPDLQTAVKQIAIRKERMWQIQGSLLTATYVGYHQLFIKAFYKNKLVASKICSLKITSAAAPSTAKNFLLIGDSITNNGSLVETCRSKFVALGGTVPTFRGTQGVSPAFHEGRPGWEFQSYLNAGSPFYNPSTSQVDFAYYRSQLGMGATKFDQVVVMLGVNDCLVSYEIDPVEIAGRAKSLISKIIADADTYATKIILQMPPCDNRSISGWQVYSDLSYSRKQLFQTNIWALREALYNEFTKAEYSGKVMIGQAALGLDRIYGYEYSSVQSASRIAVNELYHLNCVHPSTAGYQQLGDGYFLQLKGLL